MTIERRRPLPPGRYWADVLEQNRVAFESWMRVNSGHMRLVATEHSEPTDGAPARDWYLWTTDVELVWPDAILGLAPNVADASVQSSADVVQRPPPETAVGDAIRSFVGVATAAVIVAAVAVVVAAVRKGH